MEAQERAAAYAEDLDGYDILPVAVVIADRRLRSLHVNTAWRTLFGEAGGLGGRSWLGHFDLPSRRRVVRSAAGGSTDTMELRYGPGADRWVDVAVAVSNRAFGSRVAVVARDVTERKQREAALSFDATHDPLTGLQNRAALLDKAEWAITRLRRRPSVLAAMFIDLDHFKDVNDRYGHLVGDRALALVATRLERAIRPADVIGRVGGDEFVVLCEDVNGAAQADALARRLAATLAAPLRVSDDLELRIGATVGVAVTARPDETAIALIDRADQAMYRAKGNPSPNGVTPSHRDGLAAAGHHLASFRGSLHDEWAHSLPVGDADATRRWLVAASYVGRAVAALRDDTSP